MNERANEEESLDILRNNRKEDFKKLHSFTVHRIRRYINAYRLKPEAREKFWELIDLAEESL